MTTTMEWPIRDRSFKVAISDCAVVAAISSCAASIVPRAVGVSATAEVVAAGSLQCTQCDMTFQEYTALQMHGAVAHGNIGEMSSRIDTAYCPIWLLRFEHRRACVDHEYKSNTCFYNTIQFKKLEDVMVRELVREDAVARGAALKAGLQKNIITSSATRMLGHTGCLTRPV